MIKFQLLTVDHKFGTDRPGDLDRAVAIMVAIHSVHVMRQLDGKTQRSSRRVCVAGDVDLHRSTSVCRSRIENVTRPQRRWSWRAYLQADVRQCCRRMQLPRGCTVRSSQFSDSRTTLSVTSTTNEQSQHCCWTTHRLMGWMARHSFVDNDLRTAE